MVINRQLMVKVLVLGVALMLVIWFWPSSIPEPVAVSDTSAGFTSAIRPISDAEAAMVEPQSSGDIFDQQSSADLHKRFARVNSLMQSAERSLVIGEWQSLISDYPSVPELYANLGAYYAGNGELELARQTFKQGLSANQKAKVLFEGLQSVYGALAANAYKKALDTTPPDVKPEHLNLPVLTQISTGYDQDLVIAELQKKVRNREQSKEQIEQTQRDQLQALQTQLAASNAQVELLRSEHEAAQEKMQMQLTKQSEALLLSQAAEREALARVVRVEEASAAQYKEALAKVEAEKTLLLAERDSTIERQSNEVARVRRQLAVATAAQQASQQRLVQGDSVSQDDKAIELVKLWARDWSAQAVQKYVQHYAADYTPGKTISRRDWLQQRHIRLTNKEFIEVEVSNFTVKDLGANFSVTFTQHYRSNTVDDTIRKRLIFNKNGDDWSKGKIIGERRVAG